MSIQLGFQSSDFDVKTIRAVIAEGIATALFVFIGCGSVVAAVVMNVEIADGGGTPFSLPTPWLITMVGIAHGLAIALLVAAVAHISGGHLNPAVTFAAAATGRIKVSTGILYAAVQIGGAILAVLALKMVIAAPYELASKLGQHSLTPVLEQEVGDGKGAGLLVEGILTFILVFVVFAAAMDKKGMGFLAPMAIGFAVLVDHLVGVPLTGASMNPARSLGPFVVNNDYTDVWIYILGPLIGAAIAALVYEYIFLWGSDDDAGDGEIVVESASAPPPPPPAPPPPPPPPQAAEPPPA
jgi:aquaporin TIP